MINIAGLINLFHRSLKSMLTNSFASFNQNKQNTIKFEQFINTMQRLLKNMHNNVQYQSDFMQWVRPFLKISQYLLNNILIHEE